MEQIFELFKQYPTNYLLYSSLGDFYKNNKPKLATLCYEQALFYARFTGDEERIRNLENLLASCEDVPAPVSFVILSYNTLEMTQYCIDSIRKTCPKESREIVVVDNASTDGSLEWLREQEDIVLVENGKNEGFPRGCNIGIRAASKENDIMLLNSDTIVPANAIFNLRMGLYSDDNVGSVGSCSNYVSNGQMLEEHFDTVNEYLAFADTVNIPSENCFVDKTWLSGFAMLIKRKALEDVAYIEDNLAKYLDERFSPGYYEDNDLGKRIGLAGYKNILCKNSYIFHFGSKSFEKTTTENQNLELYQTNFKKFVDKWGEEPA